MIRVVVVTDIRLYRDGLVRHLGDEPRLEVTGSAAGAREALDCVLRSSPDVVLVDMSLPECHSMIREIGRARPAAKVVVLAMPDEERDVVACAELGVAGFIPREVSLEDLVDTIMDVARGEARLSPRTAATLLRRIALLAAGRPQPAGSVELTAREAEIALLLDDGLANKQIAVRLGIEVATVKNHVHHILEKLQLHRRAEVPRTVRARARRALLPAEARAPLGPA